MAKKKDSAIVSSGKIFFEGIKLYFKNVDKFLGYMAFPVLGQAVGVILIFTTVHLFSNNVEKIISLNPALNNISIMLLTMLVLTIPSFVIFFASFWKYLVAMGALNSMANNLISKAKLEDLSIHNDTVNRRMPTFLGLLFLLSLITLIGSIPLLWLILLVTMIYLSLTFQVFALEENLNAIEIMQKSIKMVKGNFFKVTFLLVLLYFFTYNILPTLFVFAVEKSDMLKYLCIPVEIFSKNLPLEEVQNTVRTILSAINPNAQFNLDVTTFAKSIIINLVTFTVVGFTLPLRSLCCTLLYKELEIKKLKEKKIKEL